jgi:hypothetical protein
MMYGDEVRHTLSLANQYIKALAVVEKSIDLTKKDRKHNYVSYSQSHIGMLT